MNIIGSGEAEFSISSITNADQGEINVNGAKAKVASDLAVNRISVARNGHLDLSDKILTVNDKGSASVGGKLTAKELAGNGNIEIGSSNQAGVVQVDTLSASGSIFMDPLWVGEENWGDGSWLVAKEVSNGELTAHVVVGMNSNAVLGGTKEEAVEAAHDTQFSYGKSGIGATAYIGNPLTVTGALILDPLYKSLSDAGEIKSGDIRLGANSLLMLNAANATDTPVLTTEGGLTLVDGAKFVVVNTKTTVQATAVINAGTIIAKNKDGKNYALTDENLASFVVGSNALQDLTFSLNDTGDILYTAQQKNAGETALVGTKIGNLLNKWEEEGLDVDAGDNGAQFLSRVANFRNFGINSEAHAVEISNQVAALAATSGVYNAALDASEQMNRALSRRMTLTGYSQQESRASLWADVFATHNESKKLYGNSGYDFDLAGAVFGVDSQIVTDTYLGGAVTVGKASGGSKNAAFNVDNDADFVGLSLYANRTFGKLNGKVDLGWMHTKSELSGRAFGLSVDTDVDADAWTIGTEFEYRVSTSLFDVVPHIGIRYTRLDVDGYQGALDTDSDTMNVFTAPIGVAFTGNFEAGNWKLAPSLDISVVPSFGDDDAKSKVTWRGVSDSVMTRVVDTAPVQMSLGIAAQTGKWNIGASYDLGIGDDKRLDNTLSLRAVYSF